MGGEWQNYKLGDLGSFRNGANFSKKDYAPGFPIVNVKQLYAYRYVETDDLLEVSSKAISNPESLFLKTGDILFARSSVKGSGAGQAAMIFSCPENTIFSGFIIRFRIEARDIALPLFINYLLRSDIYRELLPRIASGTTITNLSQGTLASLPIPLPPLPEQRAITHILGSLDNKIELNRRMNQTLEAMARAIFKSWFVDFDPVRAKAEGRPTGLPDDIAVLFPDSFEDSELGEIPKGWEVTQLSNKIGFQGGFAFKSKDWQDVGVPVVKIGSVKPGVIDLNQVSYVSNAIAEEASRFRLNVADLLIGMTGYVGEVGIVPPTDLLPLLNQRVGKFVLPDEGTKSLGFWYCTTRRSEFKRYVESVAHGTAQANVSGSGIMSYKLVVPNAELIGFFNELSQPFFDKTLENYKEIENLASLRDTLLPKLISGELRVPDAEKFIEEAGL